MLMHSFMVLGYRCLTLFCGRGLDEKIRHACEHTHIHTHKDPSDENGCFSCREPVKQTVGAHSCKGSGS